MSHVPDDEKILFVGHSQDVWKDLVRKRRKERTRKISTLDSAFYLALAWNKIAARHDMTLFRNALQMHFSVQSHRN